MQKYCVNAIIFTNSNSVLFRKKWCVPKFQNQLYAILLWNIVHRGVTNWSIKPKTDTFIDKFFTTNQPMWHFDLEISLRIGKIRCSTKNWRKFHFPFCLKIWICQSPHFTKMMKIIVPSPPKSGAFTIIIQKYCSWI